jgi:hypothetical protein
MATIAAALAVAALLYFSHPAWFDSGTDLTLPPVLVTPTGGPTAVPRPTHPRPTPTATMPHVGMAQHLDNISITPYRIDRVSGTRALEPNIGDEFLAVHLYIQNRSQDDYPVRISNYEVIDSHGVVDSPLIENFTREGLREVSLVPKGYIRGVLVFEVPASDPAAILVYQPDPLNPGKRKEWLLR